MSLLDAVFHRKREVNHLKFLFDAYHPKYWWTEVMECVRKLLLTGFVVFFYEGSGLQIFASMVISAFFFGIYTHIKPYLMPSNNTFATFVHFQVFFTLACTLLLRMNSLLSNSNQEDMKLSENSLVYALLISNLSVLLIGCILVIRSCLNTSEGDFLDTGFDDFIIQQSFDQDPLSESKSGSRDEETPSKSGESQSKDIEMTSSEPSQPQDLQVSISKSHSSEFEMTSSEPSQPQDLQVSTLESQSKGLFLFFYDCIYLSIF
ncbi:MAG TPA: hypothetical protein EYO58_11245 [Flavobacteriales bacterium]|nr:hypothetical protein [Flavobacteriales bacterium]